MIIDYLNCISKITSMLKIPIFKRKKLLLKLDEWYENDMSGTQLNFDGDW